jgi:hypothetical protein
MAGSALAAQANALVRLNIPYRDLTGDQVAARIQATIESELRWQIF